MWVLEFLIFERPLFFLLHHLHCLRVEAVVVLQGGVRWRVNLHQRSKVMDVFGSRILIVLHLDQIVFQLLQLGVFQFVLVSDHWNAAESLVHAHHKAAWVV